jgi:hypothetical protein
MFSPSAAQVDHLAGRFKRDASAREGFVVDARIARLREFVRGQGARL